MANLLKQRAYISLSRLVVQPSTLADLLVDFRTRNEARDITGLLVFDQGRFFQVFEGPEPAVDHLWDRIQRDDRHELVTPVLEQWVQHRSFDGWSMAYERFNNAADYYLDGFVELFQFDRVTTDALEPRIKQLIQQFSGAFCQVA